VKIRCVKLVDAYRKPVEHSPWAKLGGVYHVLEIYIAPSGCSWRAVGEQPIPSLFPAEMFEVVTSVVPPTWIVTSDGPGYILLAPRAWSESGFRERFLDFEPEAVASLMDPLIWRRRYAEALRIFCWLSRNFGHRASVWAARCLADR